MLFGAQRAVLYLEAANKSLNDLDGSQRKGIRQSVEKFISSPDKAFNKSVDSFTHQSRDLGTNTRAFATWCESKSLNRELCVVHTIYRKKNENKYFAELTQYNKKGREFSEQFDSLTKKTYSQWEDKMKNKNGTLFVAEK